MSVLAWLRGIASGAVEGREVTRAAEAPLPPHLAQQQRIFRRAERYRRQLQAEAVARAAREAEQERVRLQRALDEYEDRVAFGLALRQSHFPGDADEAREPGPQMIPLEGDAGESGGPFYGWIKW